MKYILSFFIFLMPFCLFADEGNKINYQEKILGIWSCSSVVKEKDNITEISVDVDYIRNGRSNAFGKVSLDIPSPEGGRIKLEYSLSSSGTWEIKENKYLIEIIEEVKTVNITNPLMDELFKLDDFLPKNISGSSEIIKLDDSIAITKRESNGVIDTCKKKTGDISKLKDSENIIYLVSYNENGAILKNTSGDSIYLGNSCDSFSKQLGGGKWGYANDGMLITLGNKIISFPNQKLNIQGCNL